jgi:hypothetical protein
MEHGGPRPAAVIGELDDELLAAADGGHSDVCGVAPCGILDT